jgi:hypothetical protein
MSAAQRQRDDINQNPFLREYVVERHGITLGVASLLRNWERTNRLPKLLDTNEEVIGAEFLVSVAKAIRKLSPQARTRLRGMVLGAMDSTEGMAAVAHEFTVAADLERRGWAVEFEDLEGRERFDLLATRGDECVEVECKSVSGDIGRKIHQRDFLHLVQRLNPALRDAGQRTGLHVIEFDLIDRLPKDHASQDKIRYATQSAIASGSDFLNELGTAKYTRHDVDPSLLAYAVSTERSLRQYVEMHYLNSVHTLNRMTVAWASKQGSCVVFTMQSQRPDKVVEGIFKQLKEKAANQFTRVRPGLLCVRLEAITREQLVDLAGRASSDAQDAPVFQRMVNALMVKRPFMYSVAFVPQSRSVPIERGHTTESSVYIFHNPANPRGDDPRLRIFGSTLEGM